MPTHDDHADDVLVSAGDLNVPDALPHSPDLSVVVDQERIAAMMDGKYIFCRKPNPTLISTSVFDEDAIRADIRATLNAAGSTPLELVMKDVHTLHDQPARLGRWVTLAREVCQEFGYVDESALAN